MRRYLQVCIYLQILNNKALSRVTVKITMSMRHSKTSVPVDLLKLFNESVTDYLVAGFEFALSIVQLDSALGVGFYALDFVFEMPYRSCFALVNHLLASEYFEQSGFLQCAACATAASNFDFLSFLVDFEFL